MKFTYPVIISKMENGDYKAVFPDLECCHAEGDSVDEVIEHANEAAYDWIYLELQEDDGELPPVTDVRDIKLQEGDFVRNICVNIRFTDGWDE